VKGIDIAAVRAECRRYWHQVDQVRKAIISVIDLSACSIATGEMLLSYSPFNGRKNSWVTAIEQEKNKRDRSRGLSETKRGEFTGNINVSLYPLGM
jgi:hypothetical protein